MKCDCGGDLKTIQITMLIAEFEKGEVVAGESSRKLVRYLNCSMCEVNYPETRAILRGCARLSDEELLRLLKP